METLPSDLTIKPRQLNLTFNGMKPVFIENNPVKTALVCALSAVFPQGEQQFIKSVRHYQDEIHDPVLRQQIRGFIGQEAHHSRLHERFNEKLIELGWRVDLIERQGAFFNRLAKLFPPQNQLAQTVALEHLTALFADYLMKHPSLLGVDPHPDLKTLFLWHAIEETEHKAVAFDVYERVVGNDKTRKTEMRLVLPLFFAHMIESTAMLVLLNPNVDKKSGWRKTWAEVFGSGGMISSMRAELNDYFDQDFHPWQHDNLRLASDWTKELAV
ncbi:MAG: metal-dependent hydrolase [Pseudomonadales bacterium]|nr:metal-dependent hydrolase [Pseudomonadales bacterium]